MVDIEDIDWSEYEVEHGCVGNVAWAPSKLTTTCGEVVKCGCGEEAVGVLMGKYAYKGLCNKCMYGDEDVEMDKKTLG